MREYGVRTGEARVGVRTNNPGLLRKDRFYWLETNFHAVEFIPFEEARDSRLDIYDDPGKEGMNIGEDVLCLHGDFSRWERETEDRRYSLFGNLGIFSNWVLRTMERKLEMFTLHACALASGSRLLIVPGGAGSGKSVFLLSALKKGWSIFSTEFVHFILKRKPVFFKGALKDAVRVETLKGPFAGLAAELNVVPEEETGKKMTVDLASFQTPVDFLEKPDVSLVFPHVENKMDGFFRQDIRSRESLLRELFLNGSEKIGKSLLLYGRMPVTGLDTAELAGKRYSAMESLLTSGCIVRTIRWQSGVKDVVRIFDMLEF